MSKINGEIMFFSTVNTKENHSHRGGCCVRCSNLEDGKGGAEEEKQTVRRNRSELTECLILFSFPFLSLLPWIHILVPMPLTDILRTSGWAAGSAWADRSLASHEVGLKETT